MPTTTEFPLTELLRAWSEGEEGALEKLTPMVYDELHRIADRALRREWAGHTLQTTAMVHEAFLRLFEQKRVSWQSRGHFFALASQIMRRILVESARKHYAGKRGGRAVRISLDAGDVDVPAGQRAARVALDDALTTLASDNKRAAQVVELRFFGGLSVDETAEALGVHKATVMRDWTYAKAWLRRELRGKEGE